MGKGGGGRVSKKTKKTEAPQEKQVASIFYIDSGTGRAGCGSDCGTRDGSRTAVAVGA